VFRWLKRQFKSQKLPGQVIALQPPGEIFPWPQGTILTALDVAIIELPLAAFGKDEPIGSVVLGPNEMEINIPPEGESVFIRLQPGMSASLNKSCQARVVANDGRPRKFRLSGVHFTDEVAPGSPPDPENDTRQEN
jgi:hypothetical protein